MTTSCVATPAAATETPPSSAFFTFKGFLEGEAGPAFEDARQFYDLAAEEQVAVFEAYLAFVARQAGARPPPPPPRPGKVPRRATEASLRLSRAGSGRDEWLSARARSGFGVLGRPGEDAAEDTAGMLDQRGLSLRVGRECAALSHQYVPAIDRAKAFNSRSHYLYWCHAEKQLLVHLLEAAPAALDGGVVVVTRPMCENCRQFFQEVAKREGLCLRAEDPERCWRFPGGGPPFRTAHRGAVPAL